VSKPRQTYRVYCFDGAAMTLTGNLIEAATDAEAIAIVEAQGFGSKCEVWSGERLVARLEGERRLG
jgi:hypothetical protein